MLPFTETTENPVCNLGFTSRQLKVGKLRLGGGAPVRIQSMTTTDTKDVQATLKQSMQLFDAGAELVRMTAPGPTDAQNLGLIRTELTQRGYHLPLVADIHFSPKIAMIALEHVEKVRINPGNFVDRKRFKVQEYTDGQYQDELQSSLDIFLPLVLRAKQLGRTLRIGVNHGSLSDRIMNRYGDTPLGMVESALEFIRSAKQELFYDMIVSMKSSNPQVMVQAYRLLIEKFIEEGHDCPLHLGVTEAGSGVDGRMKSALGIGNLLLDGLGDTIRVSLTEDPVQEVYAAQAILAALPHSPRNPSHSLDRQQLPSVDDAKNEIEDSDVKQHPRIRPRSSTRPFSRSYTRILSHPLCVGQDLYIGFQAPQKVFCSLSSSVEPSPELRKASTADRSTILDLLQQLQSKGCDAIWAHSYEDWLSPWYEGAQELQLPWIQDMGKLSEFSSKKVGKGAHSLVVSITPEEYKQKEQILSFSNFVQALGSERQSLIFTLRLAPDGAWSQSELAFLTELPELSPYLPNLMISCETHFAKPFAYPNLIHLKNALLSVDAILPPLLLQTQYENQSQALYPVSIYLGDLFLQGLGDALLLELSPKSLSSYERNQQLSLSTNQAMASVTASMLSNLQFQLDLLQATRLRLSKTEYISCPSCGRTLFDLETTTQRIQKQTGHLKGLKIAVMGCIVNGPGEMADADFGYVGAGPGKVHLYKQKELVKPNVPTAQADQELVELIKTSGCWKEP